MTAPYSPSQNSVAERMNRTLVELARAMIIHSKLPEFLWEPAVAHATYMRNLSYTKFIPNTTPYQLWHNRKPDVSHLHEFGAPVWILAQGQRVLQKMLPKSQRRAYIRCNEGSKAVKYYNAVTRNILTSCNYRFLVPSTDNPPEEIAIDPGEIAPPCEGEAEDTTRSTDPVIPQKRQRAEEEPVDINQPRKTRNIRVDYQYLDNPFTDEEEAGIAKVREQAFAAVPNDECRSLCEAKESDEWPEWERAIQVELNQLQRMGTWKLVDKPPDIVPIGNKFVFAKKRDKDGILIKHKTQLVAKGCVQRPRFDYFETHAPIVHLETIRAILAITPTRKLYIQQLDVKGAYLNGKLTERMYMKQPEGYDDRTGCVCRLIKTLYGLKQAGREWNIELDTKLCKKGYMQLRLDPCVYIWRAGDDFAIIAVWVDDMLTFTTTIVLRDKTKADIESKWEITDLGVPTKIVGIKLTISPDKIFISSSKYIESILLREGLGRSNPVSTPLDPNVTLVPNPDGNAGDRSNVFASLLGELQYIAIATRPDISYVVNRLASYTANPSLQHHTTLKRIL